MPAKRNLGILVLVLVCATTVLLGQLACKQAQPTGGEGDELRAWIASFYAGLETGKATMESEMQAPIIGSTQERSELAFARPNRLQLLPAEGETGFGLVCDGNQRLDVHTGNEIFTHSAAPPTYEGIVNNSGAVVVGIDVVRALLNGRETPHLLWTGAVETVEASDLDGTPCRRLVISDPEKERLEVWIADGDEPWVLRVLSVPVGGDAPTEMPTPDASGKSFLKFQPTIDLRFLGWQRSLDPKQSFDTTPPDRFRQVENLPEAISSRVTARRDDSTPHVSIGREAPDLPLHGLDGGTRRLSDLRGKVVVLEFWATWCIPCKMAMPEAVKVTRELADRGVVMLAVNKLEPADTVKRFLEMSNLELDVVLDTDGKLCEGFVVDSIPHSVIIDRAGIIRQVSHGFRTDLAEHLRKVISEVLDQPAAT